MGGSGTALLRRHTGGGPPGDCPLRPDGAGHCPLGGGSAPAGPPVGDRGSVGRGGAWTGAGSLLRRGRTVHRGAGLWGLARRSGNGKEPVAGGTGLFCRGLRRCAVERPCGITGEPGAGHGGGGRHCQRPPGPRPPRSGKGPAPGVAPLTGPPGPRLSLLYQASAAGQADGAGGGLSHIVRGYARGTGPASGPCPASGAGL